MRDPEIEARKAASVRAANDALAEHASNGCRWWLFTVSHSLFEVLIGDAMGKNNVVVSLADCDHISGPVGWPKQRLNVSYREDDTGRGTIYELVDEAAGFRASGRIFMWKANYDLLDRGSLYGPRQSSK